MFPPPAPSSIGREANVRRASRPAKPAFGDHERPTQPVSKTEPGWPVNGTPEGGFAAREADGSPAPPVAGGGGSWGNQGFPHA